MGVHISKVRSLVLDSWTTELLDLMLAIGNTRFNALYEGALHGDDDDAGGEGGGAASLSTPKPTPTSSREAREDFIIHKYQKAFLSKRVLAQAALDPRQHTAEFLAAAERDDVEELMNLMSLGVKVDDCVRAPTASASPETTPPPVDLEIQAPASPQPSSSPTAAASPLSSPSSSGFGSVSSPSAVSAASVLGTRALHVAARFDHILALELLLQNNARDTLRDEEARTPLQVATAHGSTRCQARLNKNEIGRKK